MTRYIAFLRGINVSGQKLIRMEHLRTVFTDMKFRHVQTYIQSGNVIFDATTATTPEALQQKIEKQLLQTYGFEVTTIVRTLSQIQEIVANNPFAAQMGEEHTMLYVAILPVIPDTTLVNTLVALSTPLDTYHVRDREVYVFCRKNIGKNLFSTMLIEKKLKLPATVRNWATMNKLLTYPSPEQ
ncbi:DUF1697 domain-containing protein [Chitinophaga pendula]|uniref:DUF1697 domain-containing protein n=1 Tax=Chitinophaga TaxID=79328 RepID=UPI000BAF2238|nr:MULTISPECIES: DUF1697 domain-containing protein [Chitinophaga]ASZ12345.1 hypothetical protein CK934_15940 [Chitinophaga sp. MD30]UCJ10061.1 DUF1697 domain-containing protein [Chitinophaga pendula]